METVWRSSSLQCSPGRHAARSESDERRNMPTLSGRWKARTAASPSHSWSSGQALARAWPLDQERGGRWPNLARHTTQLTALVKSRLKRM